MGVSIGKHAAKWLIYPADTVKVLSP